MSGSMEVVVSPESRGTVVGHCRKYTVGRRRASQSSWISSLVLRRSCRSPCQPLQAAWSLLVHGLPFTAQWRSVGPAD